MLDLSWFQYFLIGLTFIWSGFIRSGLGFGGALMSLPFLLLIDNRPLVYLPIISVHLLFFASLTMLSGKNKNESGQGIMQTIDWQYMKQSFAVMIIPVFVGVFGLLSLPNTIMSSIIFAIVLAYSISYILNKPFASNNKWMDTIFLILGGYIAGTSLIGAPLIVAVATGKVEKHKLRDTLFAIWIILVSIKMAVFIYSGVDLQLWNHLWLLPCAGIGHYLGLMLHKRLQQTSQPVFYRYMGIALFISSFIGLGSALLSNSST